MDGDGVAKYPGLHSRAGIWYVRKRVPVDLIHLDTRGSVRLSLETADKRTAIQRYPFKMVEIENGFAALRTDLSERGHVSASLARGNLELLTPREVEGLALDWWSGRARHRSPTIDPVRDPGEVVAALDDEAAFLASPGSDNGDPVQRATDQLLVAAGAAAYRRSFGKVRTSVRYPEVNRGSSRYAYLRELVGRGLRLESLLAKDHVRGARDAPFDPMFNPAGVVHPGVVTQQSGARSVSDLIAAFRTEREELRGKESTERKYGLLFRVMEEVFGRDLPVGEISRAQCVQVLNFLKRLPPNATKRFPKLTLREAVQLAEAKGLSGLAPNTVGTYMQNLTAILRWAEQGDWGVKANTRGLIETRRPHVQRRGFEADELRKIFAALEAFRDGEPTKFWVPALALFTGARAGEICQLRSEDVIDVGGIRCLNLSEFDAGGQRVEGKRLKTSASERLVPLHPVLIDAGFLDFVDRQSNQARLFNDLLPGPKESYSHNFSKWFGRFKLRIGFNEPGLVFHSFRHGFADACRDAGIEDETRRALGGWAAADQAARYGNRGAVPNLDRAIRKLEFGGFALTRGPAL